MGMIRWDPFEDMNRLWEQVNQLFEQSVSQTGREPQAQTWAPAVDISETATAIVIAMELAGMSAEEIDIQITEDTLTVKGERKYRNTDGKLLRSERQYGPFQRSFTLGMPIDKDGVTAKYTDGVLSISLPKKEEVAPKQVKIEVQGSEPIEVVAE